MKRIAGVDDVHRANACLLAFVADRLGRQIKR
jgi:hypothetical protein